MNPLHAVGSPAARKPVGVTSAPKYGALGLPAIMQVLAKHYPIGHPLLKVTAKLDLSTVGSVGRVDEVSPLKTAVLATPHVLDTFWDKSPEAARANVNVHLALHQHAGLVKLLLDNGVKVHLLVQPNAASEAVYATDVITGIASTVLVGAPKEAARILETAAFSGALKATDFGGNSGSPLEFGDVQLVFDKGQNKLYVLQGHNSWRGNGGSLEVMQKIIAALAPIAPYAIQHVPIELTGDGTLHLDYVSNYVGAEGHRYMVIYESGFADKSQIPLLQSLLAVSDQNVLTINNSFFMLNAGVNLASLTPDHILMADNNYTARLAEVLRDKDFQVTMLPYAQMTQKDGAVHCSVGQIHREMP